MTYMYVLTHKIYLRSFLEKKSFFMQKGGKIKKDVVFMDIVLSECLS